MIVDPDEEICSITVTPKDRDLILNGPFIDPRITGLFKLAPSQGDKIVLEINVCDLDSLVDEIASYANHHKNPSMQRKYLLLFERLNRLLEG